jgi:hypothetical protein
MWKRLYTSESFSKDMLRPYDCLENAKDCKGNRKEKAEEQGEKGGAI